VLAQGIAGRTPLDIGAATIAVSIVVLLGWIPLRQKPGIGTIANVVLIGVALDVAARVLPEPRALPWQLLQVGIGIASNVRSPTNRPAPDTAARVLESNTSKRPP